MTNEEAIQSIEDIRQKFLRQYGEETMVAVLIDGDDIRAFDAAISALKDRPTGKWIRHEEEFGSLGIATRGGVKCTVCGYKTHNKLHLDFGNCPFNYCPNCGADMRRGNE